MQFSELNIMPSILRALKEEEYEIPTPIQEEAIPVVLAGRDLLGCAQTGTGKTAAFAIPTLQILSEDKAQPASQRNIRALIITPTRELALQIFESFRTYGKYTRIKCCVVFGGVSQKPQEEALQRGVDILVATPGRLLDLMNQKLVDISHIKIFILDEADRMLDMGFIHDVNKIIDKTPPKKQTLLFSATMPPSIEKMSKTILNNPQKIAVTPVSSTVDTIRQYLYYVDKNNKKDLLLDILKDTTVESVLIFTRTKHGADRVVKQLEKSGVAAKAIHGDKSQGARQLALNNFKNKTLRILVATDIAARGIDIDELTHVINYDLPNIPETYVHRIGRTGRAGLGGVAISFCDFDEKEYLVDIVKLIGKPIPEVKDHPYPLLNNFPAEKKTPQPRRKKGETDSKSNILPKKISSKGTPAKEITSRFAAQRTSSYATSPKEKTARSTTQRKSSYVSAPKEKAGRPATQRNSYTSEPKEMTSRPATQRNSSYASASKENAAKPTTQRNSYSSAPKELTSRTSTQKSSYSSAAKEMTSRPATKKTSSYFLENNSSTSEKRDEKPTEEKLKSLWLKKRAEKSGKTPWYSKK
ncbi:MAG TPA: DEAD/DEAH box helicase [Mobilitalea sp.]|nr:DEAD/DEAH box helicase [Mobilitalea sp.]